MSNENKFQCVLEEAAIHFLEKISLGRNYLLIDSNLTFHILS